MRSLLLFSIFLCGTNAQAQNQNVSTGNLFEGEPYLAINPNNPQHMAVAWMGLIPLQGISIRTRVTMDAGLTWSSINNIDHATPSYGSADPALEFDLENNLYLSYIDSESEIDSGAVYLRKSIDGGYTWGEAVEVINFYSDTDKVPIDRPWIAVDRSGTANDGNIYITTVHPGSFGYIPPPYHPYLTVSTDHGESFDEWQYVDGANWLAGSLVPQPMATPCVGPDGRLHCIFPSYVFSQNVLPQYIHAYSDDAGENFNYHTVFSSIIYETDTLSKKGYIMRANPSNADHLVFVYLFNVLGDQDIMMRESFDGGSVWQDEIRINDDPVSNGVMQDLLWADFDLEGDLVVSWRDRRNALDTGYTVASEIFAAVRMTDQSEFSDNFTVSSELVDHNQILNQSGNDFMCIKFMNDTLNVVWGDVRTGTLKIWFQRLTSTGAFVSLVELGGSPDLNLMMSPNPARERLTVQAPRMREIVLYNEVGVVVQRKFLASAMNYEVLNISDMVPGKYMVRVITEKGELNGSLVVLR